MGLYLCVFEDDITDVEVAGIEVGGYDDFHAFREAVGEQLEHGAWGSRFPVLMRHHDSEGAWGSGEAEALARELREIKAEMERLPRRPFGTGWQGSAATQIPTNLAESWIDVDGSPLLDGMIALTAVSISQHRPIEFQ